MVKNNSRRVRVSTYGIFWSFYPAFNVMVLFSCVNQIFVHIRCEIAPERDKADKYSYVFKLAPEYDHQRTYYFSSPSKSEMEVGKLDFCARSGIQEYMRFIKCVIYCKLYYCMAKLVIRFMCIGCLTIRDFTILGRSNTIFIP